MAIAVTADVHEAFSRAEREKSYDEAARSF